METLPLIIWLLGWPVVCNLEDLIEAKRINLLGDSFRFQESDWPGVKIPLNDRLLRFAIWIGVASLLIAMI